MAENEPQPPAQSPEMTEEKRLDSWKEIAAYLQRDVRTVKRWEKKEGLPVHRHLHQRQATVYAYESELEAWRTSRRPVIEREEATRKASRRLLWAGLAVAVVLAAAGIGFWRTRSPALPFEERDWVLIAQFENRTGEAVFDGTLEYALERELSNSQFVNVVPRERVEDALRLMRMPLDTVVNARVGREICLRDGGIRALMAGRVEKLGATYVLSASLVNPANGATVASFGQEAPNQAAIVPALRRLADEVRRSLGEKLASIEQARSQLEQVSTPSLRALQLYSRANGLIQSHRSNQAVPLLEQALEEDPDFASAHILLAHSLSNVGRQEEAAQHYGKAMQLADIVADPERYFIRASYYQRYLLDDHKAIENLELLLRLYPDHYWGVGNLLHAYIAQGRHRQALPLILRRAELRPHDFDLQIRAAHELLVAGRQEEAEHYRQRAHELVQLGQVNAWRAAWLKLYPAQSHWLRGEFTQALRVAEQLAQEASAKEGLERFALQWNVSTSYLTLGKRQAATEIFARMPGPSEELALVAWGLEENKAAQEYLRGLRSSHRAAVLLARMGRVAEAEEMIADPAAAARAYAPFFPGLWNNLFRGELSLARGRTEEAIRLLGPTVADLRHWPTAYFFLGVNSLAQAWERQGNLAKAVEVLEVSSSERERSIFWPAAPFFWMKNQVRLAGLYRRLGRVREADEIEAELRGLLVLADADYPILRQVRHTSTALTSGQE